MGVKYRKHSDLNLEVDAEGKISNIPRLRTQMLFLQIFTILIAIVNRFSLQRRNGPKTYSDRATKKSY